MTTDRKSKKTNHQIMNADAIKGIYENINFLEEGGHSEELFQFLDSISTQLFVQIFGFTLNPKFSLLHLGINAQEITNTLLKYAVEFLDSDALCKILAYYSCYYSEDMEKSKDYDVNMDRCFMAFRVLSSYSEEVDQIIENFLKQKDHFIALIKAEEIIPTVIDADNKEEKSIPKKEDAKILTTKSILNTLESKKLSEPLLPSAAARLKESIPADDWLRPSTLGTEKDSTTEMGSHSGKEILDKMSKQIQEYKSSSDGYAKELIENQKKMALEMITAAKKEEPIQPEVLALLSQQFSTAFDKLSYSGCSSQDAWFLWSHATIDRINFHYGSQPSEKADQYLSLAIETGKVVNDLISRGGDSDLIHNESTPVEVQPLANERDKNRKIIDEQFLALKMDKDKEERDFLEGIYDVLSANLAEQTKMGNCGEKCVVGIKLLSAEQSQYPADFNAEIMHSRRRVDDQGDHDVIVLGRKKGSNPNDYTTWGADAVVGDFWARKYYFAREIPQQYQNYTIQYASTDTEKTRPIRTLIPFNPHRYYFENGINCQTFAKARNYLQAREEKLKNKTEKVQESQLSHLSSPSSFHHHNTLPSQVSHEQGGALQNDPEKNQGNLF